METIAMDYVLRAIYLPYVTTLASKEMRDGSCLIFTTHIPSFSIRVLHSPQKNFSSILIICIGFGTVSLSIIGLCLKKRRKEKNCQGKPLEAGRTKSEAFTRQEVRNEDAQ